MLVTSNKTKNHLASENKFKILNLEHLATYVFFCLVGSLVLLLFPNKCALKFFTRTWPMKDTMEVITIAGMFTISSEVCMYVMFYLTTWLREYRSTYMKV